MVYMTKQKEVILDVLDNMKKEFTIKELYRELKDDVGLTTIYRLIDSLVDEGLIFKYITNYNVTLYSYLGKYDNDNHFYLRCDKCGSMKQVDCDCIEELTSHIKDEHNFKLKKENIIINGICKRCSIGGVRYVR